MIERLEWLGASIPYPEAGVKGDTFPNTWADDGNIYASAGDPCWGDSKDGLDVERFTGDAPDFKIEKVNEMPAFFGSGGTGPKPTGMICVDSALYLAVQNVNGHLHFPRPDPAIDGEMGHGYDAHIFCSRDHGKTWQPDPTRVDKPMFPGRTFGAPAFINFGQNHAGARDGFIYAISGEGWDNGSNCRLGRVPRDRICNAAAWQWVTAFDTSGGPVWTDSLQDSAPVLTHAGYLGAMDMVYVASIERYLLFGWHFKAKANPHEGSELIVYDAPNPWGPFTIAHHDDPWESLRDVAVQPAASAQMVRRSIPQRISIVFGIVAARR